MDLYIDPLKVVKLRPSQQQTVCCWSAPRPQQRWPTQHRCSLRRSQTSLHPYQQCHPRCHPPVIFSQIRKNHLKSPKIRLKHGHIFFLHKRDTWISLMDIFHCNRLSWHVVSDGRWVVGIILIQASNDLTMARPLNAHLTTKQPIAYKRKHI
jgi:hypothetical protein